MSIDILGKVKIFSKKLSPLAETGGLYFHFFNLFVEIVYKKSKLNYYIVRN